LLGTATQLPPETEDEFQMQEETHNPDVSHQTKFSLVNEGLQSFVNSRPLIVLIALDEGEWSSSIIWDDMASPTVPPPTMLILDMNDPDMLLESYTDVEDDMQSEKKKDRVTHVRDRISPFITYSFQIGCCSIQSQQ